MYGAKTQTTSRNKTMQEKGDTIAEILKEEEMETLRKAEAVTEAVNKLNTVEFKAFLRAFVKEKHEEKEK